jgi:hypothetical protein
MLNKIKWESIFYDETHGGLAHATWRCKVPGGWLVNNVTALNGSVASNMVFLKDPDQLWEFNNEK